MITPNEVEDVLHYFYNNHDNRSSVISKNLNIKLRSVNYIIDLHLSRKKNYNGKPINNNKTRHKNSKKVIVYDHDNNFIGEYDSIRKCANKLGVNEGCISKFINGVSGVYGSEGGSSYMSHDNGKKYSYSIA